MFNDILHKQKEDVAMGWPLQPTMGNALLLFYEMK